MKKSLITSAIALALLSSVAQATEVTTPVTADVAAAFSQDAAKVEVAALTTQEMQEATGAGGLGTIQIPMRSPFGGVIWQSLKQANMPKGLMNWISNSFSWRP